MIPLTYPWIFRYKLADVKSVLDVGCGNGEFMSIVNADKNYQITGVDLFAPYLKQAKSYGVYKKLIKQDVKAIIFKSGEFDAAISSQVIEHLTRKQGLEHIKKLEKFASKKIIIGTPNGHFHQEGYDGNHLQEHHSEWTYQDFQKLGYQTYGQGLKMVYGEHGLLNTSVGSFMPIKLMLFLISFILSPLVYFNPQHAAHTIAVKIKK